MRQPDDSIITSQHPCNHAAKVLRNVKMPLKPTNGPFRRPSDPSPRQNVQLRTKGKQLHQKSSSKLSPVSNDETAVQCQTDTVTLHWKEQTSTATTFYTNSSVSWSGITTHGRPSVRCLRDIQPPKGDNAAVSMLDCSAEHQSRAGSLHSSGRERRKCGN